MIRGIGPVYAKKMVKAFGEKVFFVHIAASIKRSTGNTARRTSASLVKAFSLEVEKMNFLWIWQNVKCIPVPYCQPFAKRAN
jgi:hypothetical protein